MKEFFVLGGMRSNEYARAAAQKNMNDWDRVYLASEADEKIAAFEVWLRQMAASDIPTDRQIGFQEAVEKFCETFSL